jgi:hypothetical protein
MRHVLAASLGLALLLALAAPQTARAGELDVSYLVDARALRGLAVLHDVLTFELYADASCSTPVHVERVSALRVAVANAQIRPAAHGAMTAGSRRAARIETTLGPPRVRASNYLIVRGRSVLPVGEACQAQQSGI